jgi:hypothetical protein
VAAGKSNSWYWLVFPHSAKFNLHTWWIEIVTIYGVLWKLLPNKFVQAITSLIYSSGETLLQRGSSFQLPTAQEITVINAMDAHVGGFMTKDEFLQSIPETFAHYTRSLHPTRSSWCLQSMCTTKTVCRAYQ